MNWIFHQVGCVGINDPKIAYNAAQRRVRAVFNAKYCQEVPALPPDIIQRARSKMEAEKKAGNIAIYQIYDEIFPQLWQAVLADLAAGGKGDESIALTIAAGAPKIDGFNIAALTDPKAAFKISFTAPTNVLACWHFDWLKINIATTAKEAGINKLPNIAQIYSAWMRAKAGGQVKDFVVFTAPVNEAGPVKPYSIIGNKSRCEVAIIARDKSLFRDKAVMNLVLRLSTEAVNRLSGETKVKIDFLKDGLLDRLKMGAQGIEKYGIGLPQTYLAGFPSSTGEAPKVTVQAKAAAPTKAKTAEPPREDKVYPGKGLLKVRIENENMDVIVDGFDLKLYDRADFIPDIDWVANELERNNIKIPMSDTIKVQITEAISKQNDLNGKTLVSGIPPVAAKSPYLHASFKDSNIKDTNETAIDIREAQQRKIVRTGQLVAEIRFKEPAKEGQNVFGKVIRVADTNDLMVSLGEGVEMRDGGKYYATADGIPIIQDNAISINQILVHEGDVNLKTGNIRFNGPVEIKGSIDIGAVVDVTGDLTVHGTIRGGNVRVGGSLTAKSGVITGENGRVRVRNDMVADFAENSNLIVGGNLKVAKALVNCNVVCGGDIEIDPGGGVAAGGSISSRKNLRTSKLGFPKGAATQVFVGINWRAKLSLEIRNARLAKVIKKNEDDRNALRELARKKGTQKTKKHEELMKKLQDALTAQRITIDKCKEHVAKAQTKLTYDSEARIYVHNTLFANCRLEVGGVVVPVNNDIAEVEISPKRIRGSHILPLTDKSKAGGDENKKTEKTDKKAS